MATTTPNNIPSPDSGSNYDPTVHMAALADGVQDALTERANYGRGTTSQMNAAVGRFPDGAMWYNTSDNKEYRRVSGSWAEAGLATTGWTNVTPLNGFDGWSVQPPQVRLLNGVAYFRGALQGTLSTGDSVTIGRVPAGFRPSVGGDGLSWYTRAVGSSAATQGFLRVEESTGDIIISLLDSGGSLIHLSPVTYLVE